jgi:methionyl-tRNA formyltransferase
MKIVLWGNGNRGVSCLQALHDDGYGVELVVAHPDGGGQWYGSVAALAEQLGIRVIRPENPNVDDVAQTLKAVGADLFVMAGYGKILRQRIIDSPGTICINLHAGKLPKYRGSSPLNWALINGETSFTLSVTSADAGVDTGDVLIERTFEISRDDTIRELHHIANNNFPGMLLEAVSQVEKDTHAPTPQDESLASYYPLRFPDDGLVLWDVYTAEQIHNRIRALTEPYPCAFTYFRGKRVKLLASEVSEHDFFGEPGRVYRKSKRGLLVCAVDRCLWVRDAVLVDDGAPLSDVIDRYDTLATLRGSVLLKYDGGG